MAVQVKGRGYCARSKWNSTGSKEVTMLKKVPTYWLRESRRAPCRLKRLSSAILAFSYQPTLNAAAR
jgi:hypothetical protein